MVALLLRLRRYWYRWVLVGALLVWTVLFYRNYWQATIPAFGDPEQHLAILRQAFNRYIAVGLALITIIAVVFRLDSRTRASKNKPPVAREQGNSW